VTGAWQQAQSEGSIGAMARKDLKKRKKQPGDDRSYRKSEKNLSRAAQRALSRRRYLIVEKPKDLLYLFDDGKGRALGLRPELKIESVETGRVLFVEVKKQGPKGNADERAMKHHTKRFYSVMKKKYRYRYHPFITVFCENLAKDRRYTLKIPYFIETDHYFLWKDYDHPSLERYLRSRCKEWLD
jgi:hypothetical protein